MDEENGECEKGIEKDTKKDKDRQKKKYSVLLNRKGVSMCVSVRQRVSKRRRNCMRKKQKRCLCVSVCVTESE